MNSQPSPPTTSTVRCPDLSPRLAAMKQRIRNGAHHHRRNPDPIELRPECDAELLSWTQRAARLTRRMCEAQSVVIEPDERIVWLGKPEPWAAAGRHAFPLIFITLMLGWMLFGAGNALLSPKPNQSNPGFASIAIVTTLISGAVFGYKALKEFLSCWTI